MAEGTEKDKQRAEVFDALGHSMRIKILKALSEGPLGFAELKRSINVESGGHLKHHLNKLNGLIKTDDYGKYCISDKGKDALLTMQPIEKYNEDTRFREQAGLLIRALRSDLKSVQEISIAQISLLGPKAVPFLKSALSEALAELKNPEASKERGSYYRSENATEAPERAITGLVIALGIISVPSAVPDIALTLPRTEAFEALAKIGNKQALDAVISLIPTWFSENIRFIHDEDAEDDLKEDWKTEKADSFFRKIFNSFDEEGRIALQTALTTENFQGKNVVARVLAVVGDDKSISALTAALEREDFPIKTEAARALRRLKAIEAVPKITNELLKTKPLLSTPDTFSDYSERQNAENAWGALVNALLELGSINDWINVAFDLPRDEEFARPFDQAIINKKEEAVPALTGLLQAPNPDVQRAAAEMIARIKRGEKEDMPTHYSRRFWDDRI